VSSKQYQLGIVKKPIVEICESQRVFKVKTYLPLEPNILKAKERDGKMCVLTAQDLLR
jgi:hypothetical protein